jgi:hypothetical protein
MGQGGQVLRREAGVTSRQSGAVHRSTSIQNNCEFRLFRSRHQTHAFSNADPEKPEYPCIDPANCKTHFWNIARPDRRWALAGFRILIRASRGLRERRVGIAAHETKEDGVEIVGHRAYASASQGGDHEDRSYHRRASCDSHWPSITGARSRRSLTPFGSFQFSAGKT